MKKALEGVRILDLSRYASGPYCGALLADMGADVIKVERPGGGEDRELGPFAPNGENLTYGIILARNKKGITLNLRSEHGKQILRRLVKQSDIVVENFGVGSKKDMGLDYESLVKCNPTIIVVSITGFGQTGPYAQKVAFDSIAQAMSGAMYYTGFPGSPPCRAAVPYADFVSAVYGALGAMFALYHRERTGEGQMVDVAMLDSAFSLVGGMGVAAEYGLLSHMRRQIGNHSFYNFTDCFKAKDGWFFVSVIGTSVWRRFVGVIGRPDLMGDSRFRDDTARFENRDILGPIVSEWAGGRRVAEALSLLEEARVPSAPVKSIAEVIDDPQIRAREMLVDVDYPGVGPVPVSGVVTKLSKTPGRVETGGPMIGEHNEEVYCGLLGLSLEELERLRREKVV